MVYRTRHHDYSGHRSSWASLVGQGKIVVRSLGDFFFGDSLNGFFSLRITPFPEFKTSCKHTLQARNDPLGSNCSDLTRHAAGIEMLKPKLVRALDK